MTAVFATIPQALAAAADATLAGLGFGPAPHFTRALRNGPSGPPTHYGLSHLGNDNAYLAALQDIPAVQVTTGPGGQKRFNDHIGSNGLQVIPE